MRIKTLTTVITFSYLFYLELMRQYILQLRHETGNRMCEKVFNTEDGKPNKWWTCFAKKKFMEKTLSAY